MQCKERFSGRWRHSIPSSRQTLSFPTPSYRRRWGLWSHCSGAPDKLNPCRQKKTFAALDQQFFGINRQEVEFVLKHCRTCAQTKPQTRTTRAPLKPIKVHIVFERIQIDLIDMSTTQMANTSGFCTLLTTFQNFRVALLWEESMLWRFLKAGIVD